MRSSIRAAAAALAVMLPAAGQAATLQVISGQQRVFSPANFGTFGQSFTAVDTDLTSFGFQFAALNPGQANLPFTWTLVAGASLTGPAIATRTFSVPAAINNRTPTWFDFDVTGTRIVAGQVYTAVLSSSTTRNGVVMGPDINIFTGVELSGDAYTGGRAIFSREVYPNCAITGNCDLNFRVTGTSPVTAAPEPASWAMMLGGVGLLGGALRRRRRATTHLPAIA